MWHCNLADSCLLTPSPLQNCMPQAYCKTTTFYHCGFQISLSQKAHLACIRSFYNQPVFVPCADVSRGGCQTNIAGAITNANPITFRWIDRYGQSSGSWNTLNNSSAIGLNTWEGVTPINEQLTDTQSNQAATLGMLIDLCPLPHSSLALIGPTELIEAF